MGSEAKLSASRFSEAMACALPVTLCQVIGTPVEARRSLGRNPLRVMKTSRPKPEWGSTCAGEVGRATSRGDGVTEGGEVGAPKAPDPFSPLEVEHDARREASSRAVSATLAGRRVNVIA